MSCEDKKCGFENIKPADCEQLVELFYNAVHSINAKDYAEEQLKCLGNRQSRFTGVESFFSEA